MNENDIWQLVLEGLKNNHNLSPMTVNLWFDRMSMEKLTPDTAYFCTDNDLNKNIIESKYADTLSEEVEKVLGFKVEIVIVSSEKQSFEQQLQQLENRQRSEILQEVTEKLDAADFAERRHEAAVQSPASGLVVSSSLMPEYSPEYTFENFVVGHSNDLAYKMACSVAKQPAVVANPLYLYGAPGLGKTHLLYAITKELSENHPEFTIIYTKGEDFTNELIASLANKTPILFREKYRNANVLLIDDIQFIAGKETIQAEFFHTYEALFEAGRQIIVTSDRLPKDIKSLEERLRSRFEHGIIVDVQPPDLELRVAIFKRKALALGMNVPNDVLMYLGENIKDNIRQIEGALKKMRALAFIQGTDVCMEHAKAAVSDILTAKATAITPEKVLTYVSQKYGIPTEDIIGKRKTDAIASARQVAIYLLRELTDMSFAGVGKVFNRDHST
ncbi:MAG: chromosomal replication initiator protein DnaA, partial [Eubacteriales bacterium]